MSCQELVGSANVNGIMPAITGLPPAILNCKFGPVGNSGVTFCYPAFWRLIAMIIRVECHQVDA
tara:strand:- start:54601 stop:54792 length:192 start_codon:yes stop_codon:yes gene_type:complete